jgi:hypothetical protein
LNPEIFQGSDYEIFRYLKEIEFIYNNRNVIIFAKYEKKQHDYLEDLEKNVR